MKINCSVKLNKIPITYNIQDDFVKAKAYHLKHGVEWDYIFQDVNVSGYTSVLVQLTMGQRYILQGNENLVNFDPTSNVNMFVFDENEWSSPAGSQYPLLPNVPTGDCIIYNNKPFVNIATYLSDHTQGITWVEIAHEQMHALTKMANLAGFNIPDQMDTYTDNANPDSPTGNFARQWQLLQPYLNSMNIPTVKITRTSDNGVETLGLLRTDDGQFGCDTLELPNKANQQNISCIPKGTYTCKWTFMLSELAYHYQLQNVVGRSGIFIHAGNYFFNSKGCIILGSVPKDINNDKQIDLQFSKLILSAFETKLGKRPFTLIIK